MEKLYLIPSVGLSYRVIEALCRFGGFSLQLLENQAGLWQHKGLWQRQTGGFQPEVSGP
ncbi:MAG: hypothetical protein WC600_14340 [Desulfobaccales bacterium]